MTDKALRHYTVADQQSAVQTAIADLAVLKFFMKEYAAAKSYFDKALQFFSESGWSMIELSMLVMYLQCLSERNANVEYVRAALQLLTMSSAAELSRIQDSSARLLRPKQESADSPIKGVVAKLCDLASSLRSDVRSPLSLFFTNVDIFGDAKLRRGPRWVLRLHWHLESAPGRHYAGQGSTQGIRRRRGPHQGFDL